MGITDYSDNITDDRPVEDLSHNLVCRDATIDMQ